MALTTLLQSVLPALKKKRLLLRVFVCVCVCVSSRVPILSICMTVAVFTVVCESQDTIISTCMLYASRCMLMCVYTAHFMTKHKIVAA